MILGLGLATPYLGQAIFRYAGLDVRVVPGTDHQPWFSLRDVQAALGMAPSAATAGTLLEHGMADFRVVARPGGSRQSITAIDGHGLIYLARVAGASHTCVDADEFRAWAITVIKTASAAGFQFPQSHAAAVDLADLMERDS